MILGIDHLVVVVPDLDEAMDLLRARLGIEAGGGGVHPGVGTANRLAWFGDSYLELLAIADASVAAKSWLGGPAIGLLEEHGGGLVTFALASDDIVADVAVARAAGADLDGPTPGSRVRSDGEVVRWTTATPPTLGPHTPPFLIEHDASAAEWRPADRAVRAEAVQPLGGPVRLESVALNVADQRAVAVAYGMLLGHPRGWVETRADEPDALTITVGSQRIAIRGEAEAGAEDGPAVEIGLTTTGGQAAYADLFGCAFVVRPT